MSSNPYEPPLAELSKPTNSGKRGFSILAIVLGVVVDFASSFIARFAISIGAAVLLTSGSMSPESLAKTFQHPGFWVFGHLVGSGCTLLGGFIAGKIAKRSETVHGLAVGIVASLYGVLYWGTVPLWFSASAFAAAIAAGMLGGYLARSGQHRFKAEVPTDHSVDK